MRKKGTLGNQWQSLINSPSILLPTMRCILLVVVCWVWAGLRWWRRRRRRRTIVVRCSVASVVIPSKQSELGQGTEFKLTQCAIVYSQCHPYKSNFSSNTLHCLYGVTITQLLYQKHWPRVPNKDQSAQSCPKVLRVFYIVLAWSESPKQFVIVVHFALLNGPKMTRIQIELKLDTNAKCETKRHIWGVFVLQKGSHNFDIGAWSNSFRVLWGAFEEGRVSNFQVIWLYSSELFSLKNLAI